MNNPTIKDVARVAKVSVATVSRALNGHGNVAEGVRQRVVAAAAQLRYIPHAGARSLSCRRTHTLGVVLPALNCEFFSQLMRGIDQAAREQGLHLLVSSYHDDTTAQAEVLRAMRGRVDGMLVMSPYGAAPNPLGEELAATPVVLINAQAPVDGISTLGIDNYGGAIAMMEHLVARGHRRIAFVAGSDNCFDAHERRRGYRDALARLLPGTDEWIVPGELDEASGHRAGRALLAAPQRPDAVFAGNDMMALGCLCAFADAGLDVPGDIAVVGFDDIPLVRFMRPALTTLRVDVADAGARAVQLLVERIGPEGPPPVASVMLTPELVVRGSCAGRAPPA